ncbi:MAG: ADP-ribosylglycohydrolase family protein [Ruminococcus sp.]|jgi:ADP-ribosylglycohydrolase|nr:ADP-ribosylglycohydrolase family protein [Ruminococcus sp.]
MYINSIEYRVKSAIFGFAVGDAIGVPAEFKSREELRKNPITDMKSYGTYNVPAGTWSDDTSMTLAEMDVLCNGLDYEKIMQAFCDWYDNGKYTPDDKCFDIGMTTAAALYYFKNSTPPLKCGGIDEKDNGNGSLMRIIPFALYHSISPDFKEKIFADSALTHAHMRSKIGCYIYANIIRKMFRLDKKIDKSEFILIILDDIYENICENNEYSYYQRIFDSDFAELSEDEIKSTGYVVHTLEAALWCFLNTDSYEECVLKAVNLGNDTDTVAAIAGGLAGLWYGYDSIPKNWINTLRKCEYIEEICKHFSEIHGIYVTKVSLPYEECKRSGELYFNNFDEDEINEILAKEFIPENYNKVRINPISGKKQKCIFFNSQLKQYGIILDSKKIAKKYNIIEYNDSFSEYFINGINIRRIIKYSDNTHEMDGIEIDRDVYEMLRNVFAKLSETEKTKKNIVISRKGKSPKKNTTITEIISCNKSDYTIHIPAENFTNKQLYDISLASIYENKFLIWLNDDKNVIDISNCITGLYYCSRYSISESCEEDFIESLLYPLCKRYGKNIRLETDDSFLNVIDYFVLCDSN